jgi:UDP-N-acetylglucosamine--N-acetylmuramyl-(pentapeptide) pyrophosphoryl-undecaprenol N-acetylglucosamine transferase
MKIALSGGGTGGSVAPLLAVYREIQKSEGVDFLFIGGNNSIEKDLADENEIGFKSIISGKFRRYFDPRNFITPFAVIYGFFQALGILRRWNPDILLTAGSFVAVPVTWAAWLLKIPVIIHQQDIQKGLANKLMTPFARKITVTFPDSLKDFPRKKTVLTGNPVREGVFCGNPGQARSLFSLSQDNIPVVLILGGGTGALTLNKIVTDSLPRLLEFCQVIHVAGKGKNIFQDSNLENVYRPESVEEMLGKTETSNYINSNIDRYHAHEFLDIDDLRQAFSIADIVVTRAGISTLSELSALGKPVIIVPLPESHQEKNANYFSARNAALILNQKILNPELFTNFIKDLLNSGSKRAELASNISKIMEHNASVKIAMEVVKIVEKNESK